MDVPSPEEKKVEKAQHIDLAQEDGDNGVLYTSDEARAALRKLDVYLITMLGLINLCSILDRGNIGNARIAGLGSSWNISDSQYNWLLTMYFLAYILFHWLILVWKVASPPTIVMCSALGFGTVSMLQATTRGFASLMTCRFFLGAFEAAFAPAIPLFLSFFYNRREIGLRYGLFFSSSALANCFASAMAYGIVHADTSLDSWQLLFLVEGSPSIVLALVARYVLPAAPDRCRFLSPRYNEIVAARAIKGRGVEEEGKLNIKQAFAAFYDYKNYMSAVVIFCLNAAFNSLPAFLPTIIAEIGIGDRLTSQGLTAPPYFLAFLLCISMSTLSDRLQHRGIFITALACMGGVGYLILSIVNTSGVRYFATFLVCGGTFPAAAITFTWVTDNQGSASKRGAGLMLFGIIGQCGSILGSNLFRDDGPKHVKSMSICCGVLFFAAIVAQVLSFCLRLQNRARNRKHGKVDPGTMPENVVEVGDEHPMYRYIS